ncbi:MAG: hypothetical protein IJ387_14575 [Thermoguttaceae bacterium]|nr:hypothetical protein [Thermoguttaceae bacterium]
MRLETSATAKGAVVDEGGPSVASLRSTDRATLKDGTQGQAVQGIRAWLNDKGKIVVKAALEVGLSARSMEFAFFRSARGTLYRYPLRRLSLDDRAWIRENLTLNLAKEPVVDDFDKGEKSISSVGVSEDVTSTEVASERAVVSRGDVNGARGNNGELICAEEKGKEENETFADDDDNELDFLDFDERESSQTLLKQELNEESDEDLRLDFWAEVENDATSLNESEEGRSKEGKRGEDDAVSDDLRLNFWAGENDVDDVSTKKNKSLDKKSQPAKNNGLRKTVARKQGARLNVEIPSHNLSTRRRQQGEEDSGRKNEKKRKKTTPCHTECYELFSRMEAEELDGTLYDYLDSFDSIRDEIETERIIDYYDWTYGDARYRGEGGEFE